MKNTKETLKQNGDTFKPSCIVPAIAWSFVLLGCFVVGPVFTTLLNIPTILDISIIFVVLGGILFGVWGGTISPILAVTFLAFLKGPVSMNFLTMYVALQIFNGLLVPFLRRKYLPFTKTKLKQFVLLVVSTMFIVPIVNGIFYSYYWKNYSFGYGRAGFWSVALTVALSFTFILAFPGEIIFRFTKKFFTRYGLVLEDGWSKWNKGQITLSGKSFLMLLALLLSVVVTGIAFSVQQLLKEQKYLMGENFRAVQLDKIRNQTMKIDSYLKYQKTLLSISGWNAQIYLYSPQSRNNILLNILKENKQLFNLEYIPLSKPDAKLRMKYFVGDEKDFKSLEGRIFFCSILQQNKGEGPFFVLGKKLLSSNGMEHGWLFMRCNAQPIIDWIESLKNQLRSMGNILLVDSEGKVFFGDTGVLYFKRDLEMQFYANPQGIKYLLIHEPLLSGVWEFVYMEKYNYEPGMKTFTKELFITNIYLFSLLFIMFIAFVLVLWLTGLQVTNGKKN